MQESHEQVWEVYFRWFGCAAGVSIWADSSCDLDVAERAGVIQVNQQVFGVDFISSWIRLTKEKIKDSHE